jgi:hypothetical protein
VTSALTSLAGVVADNNAGTWSNVKGISFTPTGVNAGQSITAGPHVPTNTAAYSTDVNFQMGRDGKMYQWSGRSAWMKQYVSATNTWATLVDKAPGYCADGTAFSSCNVRIDDIFISSTGRIYLIDNNMVRYIDKNSQMQTIYGQSYYTDTGSLAISARFGDVSFIERLHTGILAVVDSTAALVREMTVGGSIATVAGDGRFSTPSVGTNATATGFNYQNFKGGLHIDPSTGWIYDSNNGFVRVNRTSGKWETFRQSTGGVSCYNDPSSDGNATTKFTGTSGAYSCTGTSFAIMGGDGANLLVSLYKNVSGTYSDPYLKLLNFSTKVQTHLAGGSLSGISTPRSNICTAGATSSCTNLPNSTGVQKAHWDSLNSRWLITGMNANFIASAVPGGSMSTYETMTAGHQIHGFAPRLGSCSVTTYPDRASCVANAGTWTAAATEKVYYCNSTDGKIYRKNVGGAAAVELPFGTTTITCTSDTVVWDPTRQSAIFGISQNGLSAVAEYYDP